MRFIADYHFRFGQNEKRGKRVHFSRLTLIIYIARGKMKNCILKRFRFDKKNSPAYKICELMCFLVDF